MNEFKKIKMSYFNIIIHLIVFYIKQVGLHVESLHYRPGSQHYHGHTSHKIEMLMHF